MSDVGDPINEARTEVAAAAGEFLADLCDLIPDPTLAIQGAGHTTTESSPVTNIPCKHEQLGGGGVQVNDGESVVTKTHRLTLPFTSSTVLINRRYRIKVQARGLNAETFFEHPVREFDSNSPLLKVLATMTEGFNSPDFI